jgi:hypothetical protein
MGLGIGSAIADRFAAYVGQLMKVIKLEAGFMPSASGGKRLPTVGRR